MLRLRTFPPAAQRALDHNNENCRLAVVCQNVLNPASRKSTLVHSLFHCRRPLSGARFAWVRNMQGGLDQKGS
jgi:hypothetical protein